MILCITTGKQIQFCTRLCYCNMIVKKGTSSGDSEVLLRTLKGPGIPLRNTPLEECKSGFDLLFADLRNTTVDSRYGLRPSTLCDDHPASFDPIQICNSVTTAKSTIIQSLTPNPVKNTTYVARGAQRDQWRN